MAISFVNYLPVNLSVQIKKNLNGMKFVKFLPEINIFLKNAPKIKADKKTTLFENKQNNLMNIKSIDLSKDFKLLDDL